MTPGGLALMGAGSVAYSFAPTSIAGCKLWLKADALVLNDNDPVGTWTDSSGLGNDFVQGTAANKPTFKTSIVNGLPVVRFDGVNDSLTIATNPLSSAAGEAFIVTQQVVDPPTDTTKTGWLWKLGADVTDAVLWTDGVIYDEFGTTARKSTVNPTPSLAAWRLYNVSSASGAWTSRLDGTQIFTTGTNTVGWAASGQIGSSGGYRQNGDVAELILYDTVLSAGNRDLVEAYIATKYALTIA